MNSEISGALEELNRLDLSKYPFETVYRLLSSLGKFGLINLVLHPGKSIIRARTHEEGVHFTHRSELSYKPARYNTTYQRASTPELTMFYGGTVPENIQDGDLDNARIVATLETSDLLRSNRDGEERITYSKWIVTQEISLVAVCYHKDFVDKNSYSKELNETFEKWTNSLNSEMVENTMAITTFLATQFAKNEIRGDYDYLISAVFTDIAIKKGFAGVYYPSVRSDGKGFNVAIAPEHVDSSLKLVSSGECVIYKKGDRTIVDNELVCVIEDDSRAFELKAIDAQNRIGRDKILKELQL